MGTLLLLLPLLLLQQRHRKIPVLFIISFLGYLPAPAHSNEYVGGLLGALLDDAKELVCYSLRGSSGAEFAGCNQDQQSKLSEDLYRIAHEKLHMLAEQTKSASLHLVQSADKTDEESRVGAYNVYRSTRQKLDDAIENAFAAADRLITTDKEVARAQSYEVYKEAIEELIAAAEQAKIAVDDNLQRFMQNRGLDRTAAQMPKAAKNVPQYQTKNPEVKGEDMKEIDKMDADILANVEKVRDEENDNDNFEPIQDSYKRVAEAAAAIIFKIFGTVANLGKEAYKTVYGTEYDEGIGLTLKDAPKDIKSGDKHGATSLQKAEEAFHQAKDAKGALLKAKEAAAKLEVERSINPEYLDSKYDAVPAQKSVEPGMMDMVKGGLGKITGIGSGTTNTLAPGAGYSQDSDSVSEGPEEPVDARITGDWSAVDEREQARVAKTAERLLKQDKERNEF